MLQSPRQPQAAALIERGGIRLRIPYQAEWRAEVESAFRDR